MCEVLVFSSYSEYVRRICNAASTNVALGETAYQHPDDSSDIYRREASRAVDGDTNQIMDGNSCSHTSKQSNLSVLILFVPQRKGTIVTGHVRPSRPSALHC